MRKASQEHVLKNRQYPGILFISPALEVEWCSLSARFLLNINDTVTVKLPMEIVGLCQKLLTKKREREAEQAQAWLVLNQNIGCRIYRLDGASSALRKHVILILVEPLVRNLIPKWERVKDTFALTPRELEVTKYLSECRCPKEIAVCLKCEVATVRSHLSRISLKMGVSGQSGVLCTLLALRQ